MTDIWHLPSDKPEKTGLYLCDVDYGVDKEWEIHNERLLVEGILLRYCSVNQLVSIESDLERRLDVATKIIENLIDEFSFGKRIMPITEEEIIEPLKSALEQIKDKK